MARGTYDDTHQRILESGMKMFLANGYERTNLRDLCADAGITTGSFYRHFTGKEKLFAFFVQPAVDEVRKIFEDSEPICHDAIRSGDIRSLWKVLDADDILDYIYRNFNRLKLLLKCADGTKYCEFLNDVVCLEADMSLRLLRTAKSLGFLPAELPSETEIHMICHAYISSLFESVLHDLSRQEMERFVSTIVEFFTAGAYKILGL